MHDYPDYPDAYEHYLNGGKDVVVKGMEASEAAGKEKRSNYKSGE